MSEETKGQKAAVHTAAFPALKPCPFCGREPLPVVQLLWGGVRFAVCCQLDCGVRGPECRTEAKAVQMWNSALRR